jgi:alkyl hydroperoxide reductase subunit AhpC
VVRRPTDVPERDHAPGHGRHQPLHQPRIRRLKEEAGIAYRASVIVDDKGVIRAYHVNDTAVGRSPKEVLRTAQALQSGGLCGADWKKGEMFAA